MEVVTSKYGLDGKGYKGDAWRAQSPCFYYRRTKDKQTNEGVKSEKGERTTLALSRGSNQFTSQRIRNALFSINPR